LIGWSDSGDLGARREKILRAGVRVGLAITGRLIRKLPARRRFHRTLLISAGPSP